MRLPRPRFTIMGLMILVVIASPDISSAPEIVSGSDP
jgi:hypothetical protein